MISIVGEKSFDPEGGGGLMNTTEEKDVKAASKKLALKVRKLEKLETTALRNGDMGG
jgi:hypothetical protein